MRTYLEFTPSAAAHFRQCVRDPNPTHINVTIGLIHEHFQSRKA